MKKQLFFIAALAIIGLSANAQWQQTSLDSGNINCFAINGNNIFAGSNKGIYLSSNNGINWSAITTSSTNPSVLALSINDSSIFAGIDGGGMLMSPIIGSNWTAVSTGFTCDNFTALCSCGDSIFAGTYCGDLFMSPDNASNWSKMNIKTNPGINVITISGNNIFVGTFSGVLLSTDKGSTWASAGLTSANVMSLVVKGNSVYAGTSIGVFISTNNGISWSAENTNLTCPKVNALTISGDTILAGTKNGGVFFSIDNGSNWSELNWGLANTSIISLAIVGNNIYAGTNGGGVWALPLSELGIKEINNYESNITVYPNPAINYISIECPQKASIEILNLHGQLIESLIANSNKTSVDISAFPSGIYFVEAKTGKWVSINKFAKE